MGFGAIIGNLFSGGVGDVVEKVGDAVHKNFTTDKERMALDNEAKKAEQEYNLSLAKLDEELAQGQNSVNIEEAKNPHLFVAGWRPFIGWLCGVILGVMYLPKCIVLTTFWSLKAYRSLHGDHTPMPDLPEFPDLGSGEIMGLVASMLGLGGLRTWEKVKGVQTTGVKVFSK